MKNSPEKSFLQKLLFGSFIGLMVAIPGQAAPGDGDPINEVRIGVKEDQVKKRSEYLIGCGQSCSFATAAETMVALQIYFQDYKASTGEAKKAKRKALVVRCLDKPGTCNKEDQLKLLDSSLHYTFGRQIRAAYLENNTNRINLRTLGFNPDTDTTGRDLYNTEDKEAWIERREALAESVPFALREWLKNSRPNKGLTGIEIKEFTRFIDFRNRDNFQFDLNEFQENEEDKLKELDPEFYAEYSQFLNGYVGPEDRLFAAYRSVKAVDDGGRAIARADNELKEVQHRVDKEGNVILNELQLAEVQGQHSVGSAALQGAAEQAIKVTKSKDGKDTLEKQPAFFNPKDFFAKQRIKELESIIANLNEGATFASFTNTKGVNVRSALLSMGFTPEEITPGSEGAFLKKAREQLTELKALKKKDENPGLIAREINQKVDAALLEQRERETDKEKELTYQMDIAKFDEFLDKLWPSEAGPLPPLKTIN